jgi:hypothetical protein
MAGLLGIYLLLFLLRRCAFGFDISGFLVLYFRDSLFLRVCRTG